MVLFAFKKNKNVIDIQSLSCLYSEPCQTSKMEHWLEIFIGLQAYTSHWKFVIKSDKAKRALYMKQMKLQEVATEK